MPVFPYTLLWSVFTACSILLLSAPSSWAITGKLTALGLLQQLPVSIFDNTTEPLSEEGKEMLLEKGYTTNWVIIKKTTDTAFLEAMSTEESYVAVQVFRSDDGGVVVLGAETSDACAAELWEFDKSGRIVPYERLADPAVQDFLGTEKTLDPEITPTVRVCLVRGNLECKPMFWSESGLVEIPVLNKVVFIWNGKDFVKSILPIH